MSEERGTLSGFQLPPGHAAPPPATSGAARPGARAEATTPRLRRDAIRVGLAVTGLSTGLVLFHPETITTGQACLAAAVMILGCVPSFVYALQGAPEPVPLLPLHGLFYSVSFGFVAFFAELSWSGSEDSITKALRLSLIGLALLYAGYYLSGPLLFKRARPVRLPAGAPPSQLRLTAWLCFGGHLAYQFLPALSSVPTTQHYLRPLGWVAIGLLYLQYLEGVLPAAHTLVFLGVALPLELLSRWVTGALYEVMTVFVFVLLIFWRQRRRVLWAPILGSCALFVLVNPVKFDYRAEMELGELDGVGSFGKARRFGELVLQTYTDPQRIARSYLMSSWVNRLGNIAMFARVIDMTPSVVPYWDGETYRFLRVSLVPRFLWPEKPVSGFGNEFGRRYGFIDESNVKTSVNLPWLPEFYANFGTWGVLVGMPLVGIAFRFLIQKLVRRDASHTEYVLALTLLFELFYGESNLALMWGNLALVFIALYSTLYVASLRWRW